LINILKNKKMQAVNLVCFRCKNFRRFLGGCLAFPNGIPDEITSGFNQHSKPLKGQKNKIVFEQMVESDSEQINSVD
jgi:hypothetical protein